MVKEAQNFSFEELNVPDEVREMLKKMFAPLLFITVFRADVKSGVLDDDLAWAYAFSMSSNTMSEPRENEKTVLEFGRRRFHMEMRRILGRELDYGAWIRTAVIDAGYIIPNIEVLCLRKEKLRDLLTLTTKVDNDSNLEPHFIYKKRGAGIPVYRRDECSKRYLQESFNCDYENFVYDDRILDKTKVLFEKYLLPDEQRILNSFLQNDYIAACVYHPGLPEEKKVLGLGCDTAFIREYQVSKSEYEELELAGWNIFMLQEHVPALFEELMAIL